ncbi:hypothetical protein RYX56_13015 [Alkalihalophilus lindianensis]|uniref:Uncharacterized protein n=1 Tax=Alkalihalophilus lindianensis TaxID=1630542 RepID=A0ABU3XCE2_9BACI|nr:hypothetical protein [Alkalihalophilus lindianensis]MDV2685277.1 hypothetical protein [Alkalihalophilus lindianensis]
MKQVIQEIKCMDVEKRMPVLRLEIDYELMTLHDAMLKEDLIKINDAKRELESLRKEFLQLQNRKILN